MIEVLEPLSRIPGVRSAALVSPDGVPVAVRGRAARPDALEESSEGNADALAGLASGWLAGLASAIAPLSWDAPRRVVLRAARGTLILVHSGSAVLLVLLDSGASAEELRLPMEAAVARLKRVLSRGHSQTRGEGTAPPSATAPKGPLPVHVDTTPPTGPRQLSV